MKNRLLYNDEAIEQILIDMLSLDNFGPHQHYQRTVEVAEYCYKINTGNYTLDQIICYKRRETTEQKEQRFNIDMPITKSFMSKLRAPLDEISRCDGLSCSISYDGDTEGTKAKALVDKLDCYGENGLQEFLDTEVKRIDSYDPNTFIVTELCKDNNDEEYCYPSEFPSQKVWNYSYEKGALQYVVVRENAELETHNESIRKYETAKKIIDSTSATKEEKESAKKAQKLNSYFTDATTFTIYGPNCAVSMTEIPRDYVATETDIINFSKGENDYEVTEIQTESDNNRKFIRQKFVYEDTNQVPAVRVGYKKDAETNFQTVVPFWWDVQKDIDKLINYNNEEVLAIAIHGILRTYNYVEECNHQQKCDGKMATCEGGYYVGHNDCGIVGTQCKGCNGTGLKIHTTTQDAILLKLPAKEDMIPLNQLMHYAQYPEYALNNLTEKRKEVQTDIYSCMYGNNRFDRSELVSATATEIREGNTGKNNALSDFASNTSRIFKRIATTCAAYENAQDNLTIKHQYPSDFKLETVGELLVMRKAAKESGAPYEVLQQIDLAILSKQCKDDPRSLEIIKAKEDLQPFLTKTDVERGVIISTLAEDDPLLILYCRFDEVIRTAIEDNPNFTKMGYVERKEVIDAIVAEIIAENQERFEAGQTDIDLRNVNENEAA